MTDDIDLSGPSPTAVGGTQDIKLTYDPTEGHYVALDLPFTADDDGGLGVKIDHVAGNVVTVRGVAVRTNYLRISDAATGELFDRKELGGARIDSMKLVVNTFEAPPADRDLAFLAGDVQVGVALLGPVQGSGGPAPERLVDQSMHLSLAGATQRAWDLLDLPAATAGTYPLSVTAGDRPTATLDVVVVDHLDSVIGDPTNPTTVAPNGEAGLCFDGLASDRYVAGLNWHFLVDGVAKDGLGNCVGVTTTATQSGTITVVASAGGLSATATLAIGTARTDRAPPSRVGRTLPSPAGDRAALTSR